MLFSFEDLRFYLFNNLNPWSKFYDNIKFASGFLAFLIRVLKVKPGTAKLLNQEKLIEASSFKWKRVQ